MTNKLNTSTTQKEIIESIPRRMNLSKNTSLELEFTELMRKVELEGASIHLTDCIIFLQQAKDCLSNHVDEKESDKNKVYISNSTNCILKYRLVEETQKNPSLLDKVNHKSK